MTSFEAGFLTYLSECGLPQKQANHILERASSHPGIQELLKASQDFSESSVESLDVLNNLYQQHNLDADMSAAFNQLYS